MENSTGKFKFPFLGKRSNVKITKDSDEQLLAAGQGVGGHNKKLYRHQRTTKKMILASDGNDPDSSEVVVGFHLVAIPRIMNGRCMTDRRDSSAENLHSSLLFDGLWMILMGLFIPLLLLFVLLSTGAPPEDIFFIAVAPMLNGFALAFANDKRRAYAVAAKWFRAPECFESFFPVDANMFVDPQKVTISRQKYVRKKSAIWLVVFISSIFANSLLMFYVGGIINEHITSNLSSSATLGLLCISAYGLFFGFPIFYCLLEGVIRFLAWIRFSEDEIANFRPDLSLKEVAADEEAVTSAPAKSTEEEEAEVKVEADVPTSDEDFLADEEDFEEL